MEEVGAKGNLQAAVVDSSTFVAHPTTFFCPPRKGKPQLLGKFGNTLRATFFLPNGVPKMRRHVQPTYNPRTPSVWRHLAGLRLTN